MDMQPPVSILFVCLGNICRSPLAEGVFRHVAGGRDLASRFLADSAGTGGWHASEPPDPRSVAVARRHGIDISGQRARQVRAGDFSRFGLILGMDRANVATLRARAPEAAWPRIHLFAEFAQGIVRDVPDPYYGGPAGFEEVYRMIRAASETLAAKLAAPDAAASGQASSTT